MRANLILIIIITISLLACSSRNDNQEGKSQHYSVRDTLQDDATGGFARAYREREFSFPEDHTAHPDYKHEWWYFTGNLATRAGRRFGYQLTFFRIGLATEKQSISTADFNNKKPELGEVEDSRWRTSNFYMAHFAVTDVAAAQFNHFERFQRNALGLAGAVQKGIATGGESSGIKVWVEDWSGESMQNQAFPIRLAAKEDNIEIKLTLTENKPIVLNGTGGLSQKGSKPGNASYYYSMPRLDTHGEISIDGEEFKVNGTSWFDREWSTSALDENQVGWDWFSIQLTDGRDIMFYQLRESDGTMNGFSRGTIISKDGSYETILPSQIEITVLKEWKSPNTQINYPSAWTITLPEHKIELNISPTLAAQEINLTTKYWEGSVRVTGRNLSSGNKLLDGYGYVELVGYDKS